MKISKAWLSVIVALLLSSVLLTGCGGNGTTPAPSEPTGVTATAGNGYATIGWPAVSNAITYNIYYAVAPAVPTLANGSKITSATSPYKVTGLSNGTTYNFVVTGVDLTGESPASAPVSCPLPVRPAGVTAAPVYGTPAQVNITWQPVTDGTSNATAYNIYWSSTPGVTPTTGNPILGVAGTPVPGSTARSYLQTTGLANGTTYYYVVTAELASGESAPSSQARALPSALAPPNAPSFLPAPPNPAVPGNGQVTITWTAVTGADSDNIYWSTSSNVDWSSIGQVLPANVTKMTGVTTAVLPNNQLSSVQSGLNNGVTYYYVITAVSSINGESPASAQVSATPAQPPPQ